MDFCLCSDVTRVLILDESQGRTLSQAVAKLLKEFGQEEAKKNFPVSPTKACVSVCSIHIIMSLIFI